MFLIQEQWTDVTMLILRLYSKNLKRKEYVDILK